MARPEKYTVDQMALALRNTLGCPYIAAERLGCTYNTVKRYVDKSPKLQRLIAHYRQRRADKAELKLEQALDRGEPWAILFVLRTQGRDRGYVERTEVTGANGDPQRIIVEYTNNWREDSSADPASRTKSNPR